MSDARSPVASRSRDDSFAARKRHRLAALAAVGFMAAAGSSTFAVSGAQAYPLHTGSLATTKAPEPGAQLTVSGSGFAPGSRVRIIELPGVHNFGIVHANAAGAIAARITLPKRLQPGTKRIEAIGSFPGGGEMILTRFFVVTRAQFFHVGSLGVNKAARPGVRLTVAGSGFVPGSQVHIIELPGPRHFKIVRADRTGAISTRIRIPANLQPGTKVIEAVGDFGRGGQLTLKHSFVVKRHHGAISIATVQDFTTAHPTQTKVAGGGAIAALSGAGLFFARRRHLL